MTPIPVFQDANEHGFGPGLDLRKSTITYPQVTEVMRVLNNMGIYGEIFVNQEGMNAQYVPVADLNFADSDELIFVLLYNGQYHELAELAVWLDKTPKTEVVKRIGNTLGLNYGWQYNIPSVMKAATDAINKLF